MKGIEAWMLTYLLNSIWQVPLLFGAGWIAARAIRGAGTGAEHRVWVSVLVMQATLPVCSTVPWEWARELFAWGGGTQRPAVAGVSVVMGAGSGVGALLLPPALLAALAIAYSMENTLRAENGIASAGADRAVGSRLGTMRAEIRSQ
jgi:hypothetical protein